MNFLGIGLAISQDNLLVSPPPGAPGEIWLFAENEQPGEDMEETVVCFEKWTAHVL